jgi:hypothetical protein
MTPKTKSSDIVFQMLRASTEQTPALMMTSVNMHTLIRTNMERGCRALSFIHMRVVSAHAQSLLFRNVYLFRSSGMCQIRNPKLYYIFVDASSILVVLLFIGTRKKD